MIPAGRTRSISLTLSVAGDTTGQGILETLITHIHNGVSALEARSRSGENTVVDATFTDTIADTWSDDASPF